MGQIATISDRQKRALPVVWQWIATLGLAALFSYFVIYHWHHESKDNGGHLGDFRTFHQAGQFAREHRDIYEAGPNSSQMYVYPPLLAFLCAPLSRLPVLAAARVWLVLNAAMLLAAALLAARIMLQRMGGLRAGAVVVAAFVTSLLSENELRAVLTMLESDPIMLLMFVLALWWLDRRPTWAGIALAFALNIKYLTIVALPYLIVRRRWKAVAGMAGGAIFFALIPATLLGWNEDLRCLRVSLGGLLRWVGVSPEASHSIKVHNIHDSLSISITSMLARVLDPLGISNSVVMLIAVAVGLLALAIVYRMYRANGFDLFRSPPAPAQDRQPFAGLTGIEWAGLITVALAFSPDTNTRHLVLTVVVNALIAALLLIPKAGVNRRLVLAAALLILIGYIMPGGTKGSATHAFYFKYSIPCDCLLIGYLLVTAAALKAIRVDGESA